MIKCVNDECSYFKEYGECSSVCIQQGFKKIITNYDHIRNMSIEEMAELLLDGCRGAECENQPMNEYGSVNCFECRKQWLESEVQGG
jgi:hypothetical protein